MKINLYATFRLAAGVKTIMLELPAGTSVQRAVEAAVAEYPVLRLHWLNDHGEIHAHVHCLLNGDDVSSLPLQWQTPLQTLDTLDIFPPVAGG
jgi:molybdopterin synthase sulfur carrier subunit